MSLSALLAITPTRNHALRKRRYEVLRDLIETTKPKRIACKRDRKLRRSQRFVRTGELL